MSSAQIQFAVSTIAWLVLLTWAGNLAYKRMLDWSGLLGAMQNKNTGSIAAAAPATAAMPPPPAQTPPSSPTPPAAAIITNKTSPRVGHLIGALERLLVAGGVLAGSWEILAAVIALKTVARFKKLDEKLDAEYFLVGSLFSIVWAIVVTYGWMAYDHAWGLDLMAKLKPAS